MSMRKYFYKTPELNGSNYIKTPKRKSAISNTENDDTYCFLWSILAHLNPCEKIQPDRVSKYRQNFNEKNIDGLDFTDSFK